MIRKIEILDSRYDRLELRLDKEIPYIKGTRIRADVIYCEHKSERHNAKYIAANRNLPLVEVIQCIGWCKENDNLVSVVLAREKRKAGVKD